MSDVGEKKDDQSNGEQSAPTISFGAGTLKSGLQIGPYKLLNVLGEGGCGVVYLAEQLRPVKRRVALKVIKPGMDTKQVIARFEAERQALALLDHPNIAHVFNAGATETGRSYFVMEHVKGIPITEHCDLQNLSIEERLSLFLLVCEAVQHAHQKGIIHRDIKPSNILVAIKNGKAIPKIIDFGVAKAVSQPLTERTLYTEQGQLLGTPEYMSPEQAEMTVQDIDTRSDVYSLGVVLYELLTGVLPFDPTKLRKGGVEQIRKTIREEEPKTPSTRLSTLAGEQSSELAKHRRIDVITLKRKLYGDLDWITIKAMEKDRSRRYETAHALAEDIRRHLNDEPISAGSPGRIYRLQKFVRRNKSQVKAAIWIVVLILILTVSGLILRARTARQYNARFAAGLTQRLLDAQITQVPRIIEEMAPYKKWTEPLLRDAAERAERAKNSRQRLHCALALLATDSSQTAYLFRQLFAANPEQLQVLTEALHGRPEISVDELWKVAENETVAPGRQLRAACVLARHDPHNTRWFKIVRPVAEALVEQNILLVKQWKDMLRSQQNKLLAPLGTVFRDRSETRQIQRSIATEVLADFAADQPDVLCSLLIDADERQFSVLFPIVQQHKERAFNLLVQELSSEVAAQTTEDDRELLAKQQANAAVALLRLGKAEKVWPLLQFTPDPRLRSYLIHRFRPLHINPIMLVNQLSGETDLGIRAGLILALGEYSFEEISQPYAASPVEQLLKAYRNDPEPAIHSAAEWTLQNWDQSSILREIDEQLMTKEIETNHRWYINGQGQKFAIIQGPIEFTMGPGPSVPDRESLPKPIRMRIDRSFAIATKEVTNPQFRRFLQDHPDIKLPFTGGVTSGTDSPVTCTWYQAAKYCRWLSEQEGIPEDQMCFPPIPQIAEGMKPYANYLDRTGYRLPSEAEWEYACRAGTNTRYCCGHSIETLSHYGWYHENSNDILRSVGSLKPNDFGLFDVHGSVWEFCFESGQTQERIRTSPDKICLDVEDTSALNNYVPRFSCGGSHYDRPVNARYFVRVGGAPYLGRSGIRLVRTLPTGGNQFLKRSELRASQPYPANGAIVMHTEAKLSWTSASGVKTNEVYFGVDPQALRSMGSFSINEGSDVDLPELEQATTYYWRVDSKTSNGSAVAGNLWSFSTGRLLAWWQFDDPNSDMAKDSTGNELNGKLMGDAHVIFDSTRGNVLSLDGSGDYVDCGSSRAYDSVNCMTIAVWIKVRNFNKKCQAIITKGDVEGWRLQRDIEKSRLEFACAGVNVPGNQFNAIHGRIPVDDGEWHHIVGGYNGDRIFLYVDGKLDTSLKASGQIHINSLPVLIGENGSYPGREWDGFIDDVRIYNFALSEVEIKVIYAGN